MAEFGMEITDMGNAAFADRPECEVASILRDVANRIEQGTTHGVCRDSNGNTVGNFGMTPPDEDE